ncbi:DsbE family thiol:disulfide interchange protein [Methylocystis parvus]|uniref:DsbE family thiol:disulfide interchange protein n=1 Tax=Methylocystis parvus TaxID=134 RepID=A0A6B8MFY4_9HYPH|nr:DsbE family thiol:disulfide interchange protein [Methylocystis parvus]QGM99590.1 DsbE family thiol:disulfide interchange protein [Methylocystis parvus]WBK02099.1 DsbE family thiol:disulfide interchange protein [Methylocystis parvus OBBP]
MEPQPRSALRFLPLVLFGLLAALFLARLFSGDASRIPSALIGKPAPEFNLPALAGLKDAPGFSTADLRKGHVSVVNIFASWCAPCRQEHPILMALAQNATLKSKDVALYGLSYKDEAANALGFLQEEGNPFQRVGVDPAGRAAIDFGVYGVPETFVVKGDGTIAYKFIGPLTPSAVATDLIPQIEKAMGD